MLAAPMFMRQDKGMNPKNRKGLYMQSEIHAPEIVCLSPVRRNSGLGFVALAPAWVKVIIRDALSSETIVT